MTYAQEKAERIAARKAFEAYYGERGWDMTPHTDYHEDGVPAYSYRNREVDGMWLTFKTGWMERAGWSEPERIEGFTHVCTLPSELGAVTKLKVSGERVIAETESGADFIVPVPPPTHP